MRLEHATLCSHDLPGLCRFFEQVFDLRDGFCPVFGLPGHWLHAGHAPLVHLIPAWPGSADPAPGGEGIDNIVFLRDDHDAIRGRLDALGISYSRMELPEIGERRLFLHAPSDAPIEIAFRNRTATAKTTPQTLETV